MKMNNNNRSRFHSNHPRKPLDSILKYYFSIAFILVNRTHSNELLFRNLKNTSPTPSYNWSSQLDFILWKEFHFSINQPTNELIAHDKFIRSIKCDWLIVKTIVVNCYVFISNYRKRMKRDRYVISITFDLVMMIIEFDGLNRMKTIVSI